MHPSAALWTAPAGRYLAGSLLLCAAVLAADSPPCQVDSAHDGNGLYTCTFRRGEHVGVWRLRTNDWISMQFYGVRDIEAPPGWSYSISPRGKITWRPSEGPVFLDEPVRFKVRSCLAESTTYDGWLPPGPYPLGHISGAVFELPGRTNFLGGGYQNFAFVGPALPTLHIAKDGNGVRLRWSIASRECQLEFRDAPPAPENWVPVTNAPVILDAHFTVAWPATNSAGQFRLAVPDFR